MKNESSVSRPGRQRRKIIWMSFLAAAAALYLTSCSDMPNPVDTQITALSDDSGYSAEQTSFIESGETTKEAFAPEQTTVPQESEDAEHPSDPSGENVRVEKNEYLEAVPYDTVYEYSEEYYEGDRTVRIAGVDGCRSVTVTTTYVDGKAADIDREEVLLFAPTNEVVVVGTKEVFTYGKTFVSDGEVPFATEYEYDAAFYDDEEFVIREGKNGGTLLEYFITYERGVEVSRELVSSTVTEPVSKLIRVGTKPAYAEISVTENDSIIKYTTKYEYDSTLEDGVSQLKTAGVNGYTEKVYRVTYYHGAEVSRELVQSTVYKPQEEVIIIGTKKEETFGMPYIDAAHGGYDYSVTQDFGGSNNHGGIDFGVWYGAPIVSVMSGTVVYAYDDGDLPTSDLRWTYGTYVVVEHENGTRTYYAHLKSRTVSVGDKVSKGDILGYSGNTGRVSPAPTASNPLAGTHLHFEIRVWNGSTYVKADPKNYLPRWTS